MQNETNTETMKKLEGLKEAAIESTFTSVELNEIRTSKNAKRVFEVLTSSWDSYDRFYYEAARQLLKIVQDNCSGFVVDIAKRFVDIDIKFPMSQKQKWCVAFAFTKIENQIN